MGIYFDFRKRLMMEFESIAGRRVELSELVFGERRDAPSGSGYDSLIDVTWGEITRGFVYNRTPLNKMLLNLDKIPVAIDLGEGLPSPEQIARGILDTYGIDLDARYFNFNNPPVGRGPTKVTALGNNPIYTGEAYVMTKTALPPGVYRQPDHEWLLDGGTADTGSMSQAMPGTWESSTIDGKLFMRPTAGLNFGLAMGMRVDGDFTLDFEMSFAAGGGYAYLFGVPALEQRGAFTFYAGKMYHYLITPSSIDPGNEWYKKMPVSNGTPMRFTIVSIGGMEHWYVNGEYINYSHNALAESNSYFLQFLQKGAWLRNLRYWKLGLFNSELSSLFNQPALPPAYPDHWFPLAGNGFNKGLNSNWFPGGMTYPTFEAKQWGQPNPTGAMMGVGIDLSQPFTLQLDLVNQTGVFAATEGLFSDSSTSASGGALRFHSGNLMFVTGSALFNTSTFFADKRPHRLTLQGDGINFSAWVDDKFVGTVTVGTKATLSVLGIAGTALGTNWLVKDLKIWSRKVPLADLRLFSELPKLDEWQSVVGLANRGSNVQMIDGDYGSVFNATYDPMATGSFTESSHGRYIMAMYYYFAIDGTNFKKKIVNFYIDVIENGNWVNKASGRTTYVSQTTPGRDVIQLSNPVYINPADPRIRIRTAGHWGDPYGYRWCTELVFLTSDLNASVPPPEPPTAAPDYEWLVEPTLANTGNLPNADLSESAFRLLDYQGETWADIASGNWGALPVPLEIKGDFTLDIELAVSPHADGAYGMLFSSSATGTSSGVKGDMFTWRNIAAGYNNAPAISNVGYAGYNDCKWLPALSADKARLTLRRTGDVWTRYRNGVLVWTFTGAESTLPSWKAFGDPKKRTVQLFRAMRWWKRSLTDSELDTVFGQAQSRPLNPFHGRLPAPTQAWGYNASLTTDTDGGLALSPTEFGISEYLGEQYVKPLKELSLLPAKIDPNKPFVLDVEIVASKMGNAYGTILRGVSGKAWPTGTLFTWREMTTDFNNTAGMQDIGGANWDSWTGLKPFDDVPQRFTIRRTSEAGGTWYIYQDNLLRKQFVYAGTDCLPWEQFAADAGRTRVLFRNLAYWEADFSDAQMETLFDN